MLYVGLVIIGICALGFLAALHLWFWRRYYAPDESRVDEIHFAQTSDNWRLALHRFRPIDPKAREAAQPIILCHGIGANRLMFDLSDDVSLAQYLKRRGWDVWVLELRGVGMSRHPAAGTPEEWRWDFDDLVERDLPAAINYVCEATGTPAVHWLGHSLGGILIYAYLQGAGASRIRSATAIGAPAFLEPTYALQTMLRINRMVHWLPVLRVRSVSSFLAPFYIAARVQLIALNGASVDGHVVRRAMTHLVSDICGALLRTLSRWVDTSTFAIDEKDFQEGLATIRTPMLVVAGDADPIAPTSECRRIIERIGSDERRFHVVGTRFGTRSDYGHGDMLIGRDARDEVFPLIGAWLEERAGDALPPPAPVAVLDERAADSRPIEGDIGEPELPDPPVHSEIPGPFGLLNRYSPTRRRKWYQVRRAFRAREIAEYEAALDGVAPGASKHSLRAATHRSRKSKRTLEREQADPTTPSESETAANADVETDAPAPDENGDDASKAESVIADALTGAESTTGERPGRP